MNPPSLAALGATCRRRTYAALGPSDEHALPRSTDYPQHNVRSSMDLLDLMMKWIVAHNETVDKCP
jgi:hypothetical protein